jgi:hypothetical protein
MDDGFGGALACSDRRSIHVLMSSKWPSMVMVVVDIVLNKDVRSMKGMAKMIIGYLIKRYTLSTVAQL